MPDNHVTYHGNIASCGGFLCNLQTEEFAILRSLLKIQLVETAYSSQQYAVRVLLHIISSLLDHGRIEWRILK